MTEYLSLECYERITRLLQEAAKTDGAAAQDLASWMNFAPAHYDPPDSMRFGGATPRCDECVGDLLPDDRVVCSDCFEDAENRVRALEAGRDVSR